jgi:hypothetical protein
MCGSISSIWSRKILRYFLFQHCPFPINIPFLFLSDYNQMHARLSQCIFHTPYSLFCIFYFWIISLGLSSSSLTLFSLISTSLPGMFSEVIFFTSTKFFPTLCAMSLFWVPLPCRYFQNNNLLLYAWYT